MCADFGWKYEKEGETGKYEFGRIRVKDTFDVGLQYHNAEIGLR